MREADITTEKLRKIESIADEEPGQARDAEPHVVGHDDKEVLKEKAMHAAEDAAQGVKEASSRKREPPISPSPAKRPKVNVLDEALAAPPDQADLDNRAKNRLEVDPDLCSINSDYEMMSDVFDFHELAAELNFGIKRYKNATYKGQINQQTQMRDGKGVQINDTGRVYEGEWLADKRCGQGYEVYKNGNAYKGGFMNNRAHGKGAYFWQDGQVYDGEWMQGCKHGFGIWRGVHGDSYVGEWRDNQVNGYGVHIWKNGDKYEGEWRDSLKYGQGSDLFANQDVYTGHYENGLPGGHGQYKWGKSGASYTGEFCDGMKQGKGKWKKDDRQVNCNQYTGDYFSDKKHG